MSDEEAFVAFVAASHRDLGRLAWLLTGDAHRAEDLVQDTLARTYGSWHRARKEHPSAYARRVMINAHTDSWRRRRREVLMDRPPEPSNRSAEPADVANAAADREEIVAALRSLTARERAVVVLRYYVDLSESQTAAELRIAPGTVKSTASRALAKLRAAQDAEAQDWSGVPVGAHDQVGVTGTPPPTSPTRSEGGTR